MWRPCRWAALPLRNNALAEGSANVSGTMSMAASVAKSFDRSKFKAVRKDAQPFGGVHPELAGWTLLLECLASGSGFLWLSVSHGLPVIRTCGQADVQAISIGHGPRSVKKTTYVIRAFAASRTARERSASVVPDSADSVGRISRQRNSSDGVCTTVVDSSQPLLFRSSGVPVGGCSQPELAQLASSTRPKP